MLLAICIFKLGNKIWLKLKEQRYKDTNIKRTKIQIYKEQRYKYKKIKDKKEMYEEEWIIKLLKKKMLTMSLTRNLIFRHNNELHKTIF